MLIQVLGYPPPRPSRTFGEAFHITSDDTLTWDQIAASLATAVGVEPRIVHVPSEAIAAADPERAPATGRAFGNALALSRSVR